MDAVGIRYDRLDGTMKRDDRTRAMDALKYDPGCEVLLGSLKAGGVGLNLTAAQRVYLMDPYWYVLTPSITLISPLLRDSSFLGTLPLKTRPWIVSYVIYFLQSYIPHAFVLMISSL